MREFSDLAKQVDKSYARREFLKDFNGHVKSNEELVVQAIMSPLRQGYLYQFVCDAKKLAEFATVARRSSTKKSRAYYQRRVEGSRLENIAKKFLNKGGDFANNVILKLEEKEIKFIEHDTHLQKIPAIKSSKKGIQQDVFFGVLKINMSYNSAFIIDGQHRLLSYLKSADTGLIRVSGLVNISELKEAKYFIDINSYSKPVSQDLIWDLTSIMNPNGKDGLISISIKKLNNSTTPSIFYRALTIPSESRDKKQIKISFSGICRTLRDDIKNFTEKKWPKFGSAELINNPLMPTQYATVKFTE